jgi:integrase
MGQQGTIEELPSGNFAARLPRAIDPKRRRIGVFKTLEEAEGTLAAAVELAEDGRIVIPEGVTFRSFMKSFLERRELRGVRDVDGQRNLVKNHIETAAFIDWPMKAIKRAHLLDWLDQLQKKQGKRSKKRLKPQTVRNALNLLRVGFQEALDRDLIDTNPARELRLHRSAAASTEEPWAYLEPAEQDALIAAADTAEQANVAFALWTGVRQGEQWAVRLEDVHIDKPGDEHVVIRYGSKDNPTKTGRVRTVPLFGSGLEAVRDQLRALKGRKNPGKLLFPSETGEHRRKGAPADWSAWLKAAGIARRVRWHDLRHTCASSLIAGWRGERHWSLSEVGALLGHSNVRTTQRYAHLGGTALRSAADRTQAAILRSTPGPVGEPKAREDSGSHEIAKPLYAGSNPVLTSASLSETKGF